MPNKLIVSVGSDATNIKKFYWDIKNADAERKQICNRNNFDSREEAETDFEEFRRDLANSVIVNQCMVTR
jgi:hypothetical protein